MIDDSELERLLQRKYAQIVLKVFLDADGYNCSFSALREEVNAIIADDSRGAKEVPKGSEYSPASLSSLLSTAKDAGLVDQYLTDEGQKRWRLCHSQLAPSQIDKIYSRNSSKKIHMDTSTTEYRNYRHTESESSSTTYR